MNELGIRNRDLPAVSMKGMPRSVFATGNIVEIWCSSPTGDSSDSSILTLTCATSSQADVIAETWRKVWELPQYN